MVHAVVMRLRTLKDIFMTLEEVIKQRDAAIQHIAEWCVAIDINGSGWDDWDEYYKDAMYRDGALPEIRDLLVEAINAARQRRDSCPVCGGTENVPGSRCVHCCENGDENRREGRFS